jgi:6-phosphogluconolactonase (cycloisomerase 2 family)
VLDQTLVLAVDLGADLIVAYRLDPAAATLTPLMASPLPAGFGPRHLVALDHDRVAVAGELTGELALLRLDRQTGQLELLDLQSGSDVAEEPAAPSGVGRTADGQFVLMANRGPNTVAAFRVDGQSIQLVDEIGCGGDHPRDLTVVGDLVYVANQESDTLTVLRIDPETGALSATTSTFNTPSPTQLLAVPGPHDGR